MKCHEALHQLDPFMDGELTVPENLKVLEHLNLCTICASAFEGERLLRESWRETMRDSAPPLLDRKIHAGLKRSDSKRWGWIGLAAAVAVALAASLPLLLRPSRIDAKTFVPAAVELHASLRSSPGDVSLKDRSDAEIERALRERGYDACLHAIPDFQHRSASMREVKGRIYCWTTQEGPAGRTITHVVVQTRLTEEKWKLLDQDGSLVLLVIRPDGFT